MVARKHVIVTLYLHCLSCLIPGRKRWDFLDFLLYYIQKYGTDDKGMLMNDFIVFFDHISRKVRDFSGGTVIGTEIQVLEHGVMNG